MEAARPSMFLNCLGEGGGSRVHNDDSHDKVTLKGPSAFMA